MLHNVCVAYVHCELFKIDLDCTGMLLGWVMCLANPPVCLLRMPTSHQICNDATFSHCVLLAGLESGRFLENDIDHEDWLESK